MLSHWQARREPVFGARVATGRNYDAMMRKQDKAEGLSRIGGSGAFPPVRRRSGNVSHEVMP